MICAVCGEVISGNGHHVMNLHQDVIVCDRCFSHSYRCEVCGQYYMNNIDYFTNNTYICRNCRDEKPINWADVSYPISDYHYHHRCVLVKHGKNSNGVPHLGFELEVDSKHLKTSEQNHAMGHAIARLFSEADMPHVLYFENDGSLDQGFEIISHPMTFSFVEQHTSTFADMMKTLVSNGYVSHNKSCCGLHVHIGADAFSNLRQAIRNMLVFFDKNWNEIVKFSRRKESQINDWARKNEDVNESIEMWEDGDCYSRYRAINLSNDKTIEIRIFRGTLNMESFMATLAFCNSLAYFAEHMTEDAIEELTWDNFIHSSPYMIPYWERVKNR